MSLLNVFINCWLLNLMAPSTNICVIFYIKDIKKEHQCFFNVSDTFIMSFKKLKEFLNTSMLSDTIKM